MDAAGRDDYPHIEIIVERLGKEYIRDEYIKVPAITSKKINEF